jgi:carbon storage regulator
VLVLSRRVSERIKIGNNITIQVVEITPGYVRIGISAPKEVKILREELIPRDTPIRRDGDV